MISMTYAKRTLTRQPPKTYPQVIHRLSYHLYTGKDHTKDLAKTSTDLLVVNQTVVRSKGTKAVMIVSHIVIVKHIAVSLRCYTV